MPTGSKIIFNSNDNFAITNTGAFYAINGRISNWTVEANKIWTGTFGSPDSFYMHSSGKTCKDETAGYTPETNEDNGWMLTIGENFGVLADGTLHCKGTIRADEGYIGDMILQDQKLMSDDRSLTLNSAGLILANQGAIIQVGNFKTYYQDGNTYWRTTGPLYIQGTVNDTPISSIELLTDSGTVKRDITYMIKATVDRSYPKTIYISLDVTSGDPLYLISETLWVRGGYVMSG
jgi:hypothetical protein